MLGPGRPLVTLRPGLTRHRLAHSWEQSFLVASTFFFISSPEARSAFWATREAGTTGIVALVLPGGEEAGRAFAVVALLVSATEAIAYLAAAGVGLARLRPDRPAGPRPDHTAKN